MYELNKDGLLVRTRRYLDDESKRNLLESKKCIFEELKQDIVDKEVIDFGEICRRNVFTEEFVGVVGYAIKYPVSTINNVSIYDDSLSIDIDTENGSVLVVVDPRLIDRMDRKYAVILLYSEGKYLSIFDSVQSELTGLVNQYVIYHRFSDCEPRCVVGRGTVSYNKCNHCFLYKKFLGDSGVYCLSHKSSLRVAVSRSVSCRLGFVVLA